MKNAIISEKNTVIKPSAVTVIIIIVEFECKNNILSDFRNASEVTEQKLISLRKEASPQC